MEIVRRRRNRPGPVQWYGGKCHIAHHIVRVMPRSRIYCEVYGGAAAVLMNLPPRPVEVYNDINGDLVNLFRALQDEARFRRLARRLKYTLYSRAEFDHACAAIFGDVQDQDERAWAFYVIANQGWSGITNRLNRGQWSRAFVSNRHMAGNASRWWSRFDTLPFWHRRLARVQIDCRDALEVIRYWDCADTTFYLDPPYVHSTRRDKEKYRHEVDDEQHVALAQMLLSLRGQAILSGYENPIYNNVLKTPTWEKIRISVFCPATNQAQFNMEKRSEVLWIKQNRGFRRLGCDK